MTQPICTAPDLTAALAGKSALFTFLRDTLAWNVDPEDTFTYADPEAAPAAEARASLSQIVPFSAGDPFVIFLVEFKDKFRRGDLREILRGVRRQIRERGRHNNADTDELIFVCTTPKTQEVLNAGTANERVTEHPAGLRFVRFEERENRQARLRVFGYDADTVRETHTLRTMNLPLLVLKKNLLGEVDWNVCRADWEKAWDVERVTTEFFKDYKRVFNTVRDSYIGDTAGEKQLFTQRLFNRLMFIHFLSKKGWLRFGDRADYLFALRDAARDAGENLYRDRLYWAFFNGLGVGAGATPATHTLKDLVEKRGEVPYLNGGLFEMAQDGTNDDTQGAVTIDNEAFDLILGDLFGHYNFTVAESSPDDADVAVDPEMLGKVFEELVNGRHESGSYYTPRPVVQFMCREALKGYLADFDADDVSRLVDLHDGKVKNPRRLLKHLDAVKVVDPACGSGAYLLGMLQELMAIKTALFESDEVDDKEAYDAKLEIIQNNLFGVDLDMFAVNTARLRLWLSLVVEQTTNPLDDRTHSVALPNLDFKIEQGDSVSSPDPSVLPVQRDSRSELIRQFDIAKREYGDVRYLGDKTILKSHIADLRSDIASQTPF